MLHAHSSIIGNGKFKTLLFLNNFLRRSDTKYIMGVRKGFRDPYL